MSDDKSPNDISIMLADEIDQVCRDLGVLFIEPRGGRSIRAYCPWNHPHSKAAPKLYIDVKANRGGWIEFRSGETGDALWLVALTLSGGVRSRDAIGEALRWARDRYGFTKGTFDQVAWARQIEEAKRRSAAREAEALSELKKNRGRAHAQWLKGQRLKADDAGYRYFEARGIDFKYLGRMPGAVRFEPLCQYWDAGKIIYTGPALLTAMTLPDGSFGAVHRTFIDPDMPGEKLDLGRNAEGEPLPPRKMWPDSGGCVMRLWRGSSGLSEKDAAANGLLEDVIVCEGVEDGYSLAMIDKSRRIIAAGSLAGLLRMMPPACADAVTISADNDWGKPQAQKQLDRAIVRLSSEFDVTVSIVRSPVGKDFNDLIRGRA